MTDNEQSVLVHLEYIREAVDGVNERLDAQNGRLREAEQDIAVLKDRSDDAKTTGRNWGATAGAIGGLIGGFVAGLFGGGK